MAIHQKFTGDPSQLIKAYEDLARANNRLEQQVAKLGGAMGDTSNQGVRGQLSLNAALKQGAIEVQSFAQQWLGVGGAIYATKMEFDQLIQLRERASATNVSVGGSEADIVRNMPGTTSTERQAMIAETRKAFAKSGFPDLREFNRAVASGLSASAGDRAGVLDAVLNSAQLTRDSPQDLADMVGAAIDIQKASGIKDAQRNIGFMLKVGGENRLVDMRTQARNLPGALTTAANTVKGDKQQATIEGGALFAALGTVADDWRGESTRTAVQSFTVQLRDFFEKGVEKTVRGHKFRDKPKFDPGTIGGRITALQEDDKLRKKFEEFAHFEQQFKVPIEQLIRRGGITDQYYRQAARNIDFDRGEYTQTSEDLRRLTPAISLASTDASAKGQLQLSELVNDRAARINQANEIRASVMREAGRHSPNMVGLKTITDSGETAFNYIKQAIDGTDPIQDAIDRVERRRRDILQPGSLLGGKDNFAYARKPEELSRADQNTLRFVDEQLALLRQLLEQDKASAKAMEEQTQVMREIKSELQTRTTSPAAARQERGIHREQ